MALDYYTGARINGTLTIIPVENPQNKTTATITNGEWSTLFNIRTNDVKSLTFVINSSQKTGYNYMKLGNPVGTNLNCTRQNITLSGYSVNVNGVPITSGNIKVSVIDTDYSTTSSISGNWTVNFYPCLISGNVYTIQILLTDNTGSRGEAFQTYAAK
jgi:hypothetical protein